MRLFYWETAEGPNNFGDALNSWIWPRELGSLVGSGNGPWLVGIGSLLGDARPFPEGDLRLVMGAGAGYGRPPALDESWRVYAVRGPRTAQRLRLPPETSACDPAILARRHFAVGAVAKGARVALMLHWRSVNEVWRAVADDLGWTFVDPRDEPEAVMRGIAGAELLLAEALHGAVVADAFRVPWIPLRTSREILAFKWEDWCASIRLGYAPVPIRALYPRPDGASAAHLTKRAVKRLLVERELKAVARRRPVLSADADLARAGARLDAALDRLRDDAARGSYRGWLPVSRAGDGSRRAAGG